MSGRYRLKMYMLTGSKLSVKPSRSAAASTLSITVPDEPEDHCPDEEDDADDRQPEQSLERKADNGENRPDDQQDYEYCPHGSHRTRSRC